MSSPSPSANPGGPCGARSRVLIYSHDSFGLGHLRRCRTIAGSLVRSRPDLSVLILSGSPLIGSFEFPPRVDFVRVPGVIKLRNGNYSSLSLDLDIREATELREAIIRHTALAFRPHLLIVDKEPLGLRGEMGPTLEVLREMGTRLVLGIRDVMDEPALLAKEWARKNPVPALRNLYDQIWVYGVPHFWDPLDGIELPPEVREKEVFTGYLRRETEGGREGATAPMPPWPRFLLVTPGGGGDGGRLVDWVIRAYESPAPPPHPAVVVFGPFMPARQREDLRARAARLPSVAVTTFDTQLEVLMKGAAGVVAMGGYNTFCEILSFDKPALVVPRRVPRLEQTIRARRASELGLIRMLEEPEGPPGRDDVERMCRALRALPDAPRPSEAGGAALLGGLDTINARVAAMLGEADGRRLRGAVAPPG